MFFAVWCNEGGLRRNKKGLYEDGNTLKVPVMQRWFLMKRLFLTYITGLTDEDTHQRLDFMKQ